MLAHCLSVSRQLTVKSSHAGSPMAPKALAINQPPKFTRNGETYLASCEPLALWDANLVNDALMQFAAVSARAERRQRLYRIKVLQLHLVKTAFNFSTMTHFLGRLSWTSYATKALQSWQAMSSFLETATLIPSLPFMDLGLMTLSLLRNITRLCHYYEYLELYLNACRITKVSIGAD